MHKFSAPDPTRSREFALMVEHFRLKVRDTMQEAHDWSLSRPSFSQNHLEEVRKTIDSATSMNWKELFACMRRWAGLQELAEDFRTRALALGLTEEQLK